MVQSPVELIDRGWPKGVANLWPIKGDPNRSLVDTAVVGHVDKVETVDGQPALRIEQV
jgi:hypothetical protein